MDFSLKLLGGVSLEGPSGPVSGRAAHKRRLALLAILGIARRRPVSRERVLGLLWPESSSSAGRHLLSESLTVLRRELGDDVFICRGDDLVLNGEVVSCDVGAFEEALERGDAAGAVAAYGGAFLEGFYVADAPDFDRWAEAERDRIGRTYAKALESLAEGHEQVGDWRGAVEWWRRLAVHDAYSSRVALRLMQALAAAGEREAALRHARVHAALLREELGTESSAEVRALVESLRNESPAPQAQGGVSAAPAHEPAAPGAAPGSLELPRDSSGGEPDAGEYASPAVLGVEPEGRLDEASLQRDATVWFADIVGFSALLTRDPSAARQVLSELQETARREVRRVGGHVVEFIGDGVLAEFSDARAAIRSAIRLLRTFERRAREAGVSATLQVGVHAGSVSVTDDGGVYGEPVSVASRLQGRADPGQVLVSGEVRTRLDRFPEFRFAGRGVLPLPGLDVPVSLVEVELERRRTAPGQEQGDPPARRAPTERRRPALLPVAAIVLLVAGILLSLRWLPAHPLPTGGELDPNRVAVLYLTPTTPDDDLRALARGLTDQLIHELSQVDALDVVSPSGVRPYRDAAVPLDSVARALHAGTLLEGSLKRSGEELRLTLFLVDAATGERLRSTVLRARAGDPLALEEQLAREAARFLRWRLGRNLEVRTHTSGTRSPVARELVLRAEQAREDAHTLLRSQDTLEKGAGLRLLAHADTLLMRAEAADPQWPEPVTLRGWVAVERGTHSPLDAERRLLTAAMGHADRSLRLRPDDPRALELRGNVRWTLSLFHQRPDSAERLVEAAATDLKAAVDRDPRRATAWSMLSQLLRVLGDHHGAYLAADRAVHADAYLLKADQVRHRLFRIALAAGRFDLAREHCEAGMREFPDDWRFVECPLVLLAYDDGRPPDVPAAGAALQRIDQVDAPPVARADGRAYLPVYRQMLYAAVLARAGQNDSARAVMARARGEIESIPEMRASFAHDEAHVRLSLGDRAGAVRALRELVQLQPQIRRSVGADHLFRSLRSDSEFRMMIRAE